MKSNDYYKALYLQLPTLLPKLGLRLGEGNYEATMGTTPCCDATAQGHLYVYKDNPYGLKCHRCDEFTHLSKLLPGGAGVGDQDLTTPNLELSEDEAKRQHRHELCEKAKTEFMCNLFPAGQQSSREWEYLQSRGIDLQYAFNAGFGLYTFYSKAKLSAVGLTDDEVADLGLGDGWLTGRLIVPWLTEDGLIAGFWARPCLAEAPVGVPKYIITPGTSKDCPTGYRHGGHTHVLVIEGLMAMHMLRSCGIPNVVGIGGSKVSEAQAVTMRTGGVTSVTLSLDHDVVNKAGEEGTVASIKVLKKAGIAVTVVPPWWLGDPNAPAESMDPDKYVLRFGVERYKWLVAQGIHPCSFLFLRAIAGIDLATETGVNQAVEHAVRIMDEQAPDRLATERVLADVAGWLKTNVDALRERIDAVRAWMQEKQRRGLVKEALARGIRLAEHGDIGAVRESLDTAMTVVMVSSSSEPVPYFDDVAFMDSVRYGAPFTLMTGYDRLDDTISIAAGELVILAARARHGKSTVAYNMVINGMSRHDDAVFVLVSHELPIPFFVARMATIFAQRRDREVRLKYKDDIMKNYGRTLNNGSSALPLPAQDAIRHFGEMGRQKRLVLVNRPEWNAVQISDFVTQVQQDGRMIGGVFIDYVEMLPALDPKQVREQQIGQTVHELRLMANRLNIPVILLSQMNRENKTPSLEGLRYSGQLEQEASTVLGLYNASQEDQQEGENAAVEVVDLKVSILKNRGGAQGLVTLTFDMATGLISER